jgi:hypothetical protein
MRYLLAHDSQPTLNRQRIATVRRVELGVTSRDHRLIAVRHKTLK